MKPYSTLSCLIVTSAIAGGALAQEATCTVRSNDPQVRDCKGINMFWTNRSFLLYVPAGKELSSEPLPLVLDFHGTGSSKDTQMGTSCWRDLADSEGFVVAYPNGTGIPNSFQAGSTCCGVGPLGGRDDVAFARRIVADVRARLNIDPARIFVTGWSNGGKMAHHLACEANDLFTAAASMSQSYSLTASQTCLTPSERRIPLIDFRAAGDTIVPYGFNTPFSLSAEVSMNRWAQTLGCEPFPGGGWLTEDYQAVGPESAICQQYQGCDTALVQCSLQGGHNVYDNPDGMDTCRTAWQFWEAELAQ